MKKYLKLLGVFILSFIFIFLMLHEFIVTYRINNFININIDEIKEFKIIEKDISIITEEDTYATKELNIKSHEKRKILINKLNKIRLNRDFKNELLHKLGKWVSFPITTSSIEYKVYIRTLDEIINIEIKSGNTYIDLNIRETKKDIGQKQYYFKIKDKFTEELIKP